MYEPVSHISWAKNVSDFKCSPLTIRTYRLPVVYVFGRKPIDVVHCVAQFVNVLNTSSAKNETTVLLRHDVAYTHYAGELPFAIMDVF
jgi:diphthamide biosynthesis protein 2